MQSAVSFVSFTLSYNHHDLVMSASDTAWSVC